MTTNRRQFLAVTRGATFIIAEQPTVTIADRLRAIHALQSEVSSSPYSHDLIELSLAIATSCQLSKASATAPVWLLLVGAPSSDKTNTAQSLKGLPTIHFVDTFSENGLASGFLNEQGQQKRGGLLASFNYGCLILKDLTTFFAMREERIKKLLGELQGVFDGELVKESGAGEAISWSGHISLLGCVTPQSLAKHQRYMSSIGQRFLFYTLPPQTEEEHEEGFAISRDRAKRLANLTQLRGQVRELFKALDGLVQPPDDSDYFKTFNMLAIFLAKARAASYRERDSTGEYELISMQVEEPYRVHQQLYTLAQSLALVHGRASVTAHEIELVKRAVWSTIPTDRRIVLEALCGGEQPRQALLTLTGKSLGRAGQTLEELEHVKLIAGRSGTSTGGRPPMIYTLTSGISDIRSLPILDHIDDLV
jgi:hypothetical protein